MEVKVRYTRHPHMGPYLTIKVVIDSEDYIDKAHSLLAGTNTNKTIMKDPTNKLKNKLYQILRDLKN